MLEYLTLNPPAVGLDISEETVRVAAIKRKKGAFFLNSLGVESLDNSVKGGKITDKKEVVKKIKKVINTADGSSIKTSHIVLSIPERDTFTKTVEINSTKEGEVENLIHYNIETNFPFSIEEVYFDYKIVEKRGKKTRATLFAAPKNSIDQWVSVLKEANLKIRFIEFKIESIRRFIKFSKQKERSLFINLNRDGTVLGFKFPNNFSSSLFLSNVKSNSIKDGDLDKINSKIMEIKKSINFLVKKAGVSGDNNCAILSSEDRLPPGFISKLKEALAVDLSVKDELNNLSVSSRIDEDEALNSIPAIGLALRNFEENI